MKVSNSSNSLYFSNESFDFKPFSEDELAIIMGGGDDDLASGFSLADALTDEDLLDE